MAWLPSEDCTGVEETAEGNVTVGMTGAVVAFLELHLHRRLFPGPAVSPVASFLYLFPSFLVIHLQP